MMTVGADQRSCQSWPPVTSGGQCPYSTARSTSVQALYSADRGDHWPELTSSATRHWLLTLCSLCSSLAPEFPVPWQWRPVTAHSGQWPRHGPGEPGTTSQPLAPARPLLLSYAIIASLTNYMGTGGRTRIFGTNTKYESQLTIRYLCHD